MNIDGISVEELSKLITNDIFLSVLKKIGLTVITLFGGLIAIKYVDALVTTAVERVIGLKMNGGGGGRAAIRKQTLTNIAHHAIVWLGYLVILLMILDIVGLDIRPILATAGVASLAIGFGAQSLVKDIISGFFIILEDQYGTGDVVNIDGDTGVVENLNLRTTHLRNAEGVLIVKNNGNISVTKNMSKEWSRIDFRIGVSYSCDIEKVMGIIRDEGLQLRRDFPQMITHDPEMVAVESFNESDITVRMWLRTAPGENSPMRRELNKRIKIRFDKEGVEIPFPQRVVWNQANQRSN